MTRKFADIWSVGYMLADHQAGTGWVQVLNQKLHPKRTTLVRLCARLLGEWVHDVKHEARQFSRIS